MAVFSSPFPAVTDNGAQRRLLFTIKPVMMSSQLDKPPLRAWRIWRRDSQSHNVNAGESGALLSRCELSLF
jgi:hypothetical protein